MWVWSTMIDFSKSAKTLTPGSTEDKISHCEHQLEVSLPEDYRSFLQVIDEEDVTSICNASFSPWRAHELFVHNVSYGVKEFCPGALVIGSNGGGEAFAFDTRGGEWNVVRIPFIPMSWDEAIPIAENFTEFLKWIERAELD